MVKHNVTAVIEAEGNGYVALCPELDVASQGDTTELFFETARPQEVSERLHTEIYVTRLEVTVG